MNNILLVDDDKDFCELLSGMLDGGEYKVDVSFDAKDALEHVKKSVYDVVLTDLKMPDMDGLDLLAKVKLASPSTIVIIMTAYGTVQNAVEAMKQGAFDYILKPFSTEEVKVKISKAFAQQKQILKNEIMEETIQTQFGPMIGSSSQMKQVYNLISKVASTNTSVLITGPSGTGKELAAHELYKRSSRANAPFVDVKCVAFASEELQRELFGYENGVHTDGSERKRGRLELANGGTLFLDEIGDLNSEIQAKLMGFLEEGNFHRQGGKENVKVDVRIISSTTKDVRKLITEGKFREDLFFKLNTFSIEIPSLKERGEDLYELINHYLFKYNKEQNKKVRPSSDVIDILSRYNWPGNIRELDNVISQSIILADGEFIEAEHLPIAVLTAVGYDINNNMKKKLTLASQMNAIEAQVIREALEETGWNQVRAAKKLGYKRTSLQYKMKKYGLLQSKSK